MKYRTVGGRLYNGIVLLWSTKDAVNAKDLDSYMKPTATNIYSRSGIKAELLNNRVLQFGDPDSSAISVSLSHVWKLN